MLVPGRGYLTEFCDTGLKWGQSLFTWQHHIIWTLYMSWVYFLPFGAPAHLISIDQSPLWPAQLTLIGSSGCPQWYKQLFLIGLGCLNIQATLNNLSKLGQTSCPNRDLFSQNAWNCLLWSEESVPAQMKSAAVSSVVRTALHHSHSHVTSSLRGTCKLYN